MKPPSVVALLAFTLALYGAEPEGLELPYRFTVSWSEGAASLSPAFVVLPEALPETGATLFRKTGDAWEPVPSQLDPAELKRLWWMAEMPEDGMSMYALRAGKTEFPKAVTTVRTEQDLTVKVGERPVLTYRYAPMPPPKGVNARFTRSGFIHPLYSPGGEVLTAIHPRDHYHHLGLWNPWTSTEFAGQHVDFWNLAKGQGTVRFVRFESVTDGPVFGGFRAVLEHVALKTPGGETVVLRELCDVRVWHTKDSFLVDFSSTQACVAKQPLMLNAYRYGGFGFRGRTGWGDANSDYLTSEGKTRANGHASRSRWCHVYGETPQGGAGVLFMSNPENREHPEPMRLWPKGANRGKDNVFFNFCPVQKKPWLMESGRSYTLRYRFCVYDGKPADAPAEPLWRAFAHPPVAKTAD